MSDNLYVDRSPIQSTMIIQAMLSVPLLTIEKIWVVQIVSQTIGSHCTEPYGLIDKVQWEMDPGSLKYCLRKELFL